MRAPRLRRSLQLCLGMLAAVGCLTLSSLILDDSPPGASAREIPANPAAETPSRSAGPVLVALRQIERDFDLTIEPGHTVTRQVDRLNPDAGALTARTFVAAVSPRINGGFGTSDSALPPTGTAAWVGYPPETIQLAGHGHSPTAFTVTVPPHTRPGQYISSIVIEDVTGEREPYALAISISVPGTLTPAFALGTSSVSFAGAHPVVSVGIHNTGNQTLTPIGILTLTDASDRTYISEQVTMGSLFAHTSTRVSVLLSTNVPPGPYTLSLTLTDPRTNARASLTGATLLVPAPALSIRFDRLLDPVRQMFDSLRQMIDYAEAVDPLLVRFIFFSLYGALAIATVCSVHLIRRRMGPGIRMPLEMPTWQ